MDWNFFFVMESIWINRLSQGKLSADCFNSSTALRAKPTSCLWLFFMSMANFSSFSVLHRDLFVSRATPEITRWKHEYLSWIYSHFLQILWLEYLEILIKEIFCLVWPLLIIKFVLNLIPETNNLVGTWMLRSVRMKNERKDQSCGKVN